MLTNGQKKALHAAARAAGIDDAGRRLIQRNVGGFHSAADRTATRAGFIACMAFYEARCGGRLMGARTGYWTAEDEKASPTDALVRRCRQEADALGMGPAEVNHFLAGGHMSSGQYDDLATCPAYWLRKLLEGLKAIGKRQQATGTRLRHGKAGLRPGDAGDQGPGTRHQATKEPVAGGR